MQKALIPKSEIKKILLIQYKPFGDVLLNTGYMPELRKQYPDAQIDFLVESKFATLLEDNPNLDNLIIIPKYKKNTVQYFLEKLRALRRIRKEKYDVIIDQLSGIGSSQLVLFSGAKYRITWNKKFKKGYGGFCNRFYNFLYERDNHIYYSRSKFRLLEPLGIKEVPHNTYYYVKDESKASVDAWMKQNSLKDKKFILISPITPIYKKQWNFSYFAKVADKIQKKYGFKIVFSWGPGEKEKVEEIMSLMETPAIIRPKSTLNEVAALLQKAYMYLGNDGGVNHVAVAMNTPAIAIFAPRNNPQKWTAWHREIYKAVYDQNLKEYKDDTLNVTPEMVFETFEELCKTIESKKD